MKIAGLIIAMFLTICVFAQSEKQEKVDRIPNGEKPECIIWPAEVAKITPVVFNSDEYYRTQVKQPYGISFQLPCGNSDFDLDAYIISRGPEPLNENLPFVNTLRGSVYTFDYLRYQVR